MWNLFRCLLKTLVALPVDDVLISGLLRLTVAATIRIGVIAAGVIGAAYKLIAGVAGVGMHPSVAGLQPMRYALVTVLLVWSSVTHGSES